MDTVLLLTPLDQASSRGHTWLPRGLGTVSGWAVCGRLPLLLLQTRRTAGIPSQERVARPRPECHPCAPAPSWKTGRPLHKAVVRSRWDGQQRAPCASSGIFQSRLSPSCPASVTSDLASVARESRGRFWNRHLVGADKGAPAASSAPRFWHAGASGASGDEAGRGRHSWCVANRTCQFQKLLAHC